MGGQLSSGDDNKNSWPTMFPSTDQDDTGTQQHWGHFVEHLKCPVVDGNIGWPNQKGQYLGK